MYHTTHGRLAAKRCDCPEDYKTLRDGPCTKNPCMGSRSGFPSGPKQSAPQLYNNEEMQQNATQCNKFDYFSVRTVPSPVVGRACPILNTEAEVRVEKSPLPRRERVRVRVMSKPSALQSRNAVNCPPFNFTITSKMPQNVPKCHTFRKNPLLPLQRIRTLEQHLVANHPRPKTLFDVQ